MLIAQLALVDIILVINIVFRAQTLVPIVIYAQISILAQIAIYNTQDLFVRLVQLAIINIALTHLYVLHVLSSVVDARNASMEPIVVFA